MKLIPVAVVAIAVASFVARPEASRAAVSQTRVDQACASGTTNVSFTWQDNDPKALEQWVDLSLFDNGWQTHSYMSAGPLTASTTNSIWNGLPPRVPFFVRVNQQIADGSWDPGQTIRFTTADCASTAVSASAAPVLPPAISNAAPATSLAASAQPPTATSVPAASIASGRINLFPAPRPQGLELYMPAGALGYFFTVSGFDLEAMKGQMTVTLAGPGGNVPTTLSASAGGWSWQVGVPGGITVWLSPNMPTSKYTLNVALPNGATASAVFVHYIQSAQ